MNKSEIFIEILNQIKSEVDFGKHMVVKLSSRILLTSDDYIISIETYSDDPETIVTQFAVLQVNHFTQESVSIHDPSMIDTIKEHIVNGLVAAKLFQNENTKINS